MSFRTLARSSTRALNQLQSSRSSLLRLPLRNQTSMVSAWRPIQVPKFGATFASCAIRRQGNEELVAKLTAELQVEESNHDANKRPKSIKDYLANSSFEIDDTSGKEEVVLTRKHNDERIRVAFSIADLSNFENEQEDLDEDSALGDEEEANYKDELESAPAGGKDGLSSSGSKGKSAKAAESDDASEEVFDTEDREPSFPAHTTIRIERPGKGALCIEAEARDGAFLILSAHYFQDAALIEPKTLDKEVERRSLYTGPAFHTLDEELQLLMEKYLEERGINTRMALFIPDYIDWKEQGEYVKWLKNVKTFVE